jgi:hypothetical protein
VVDSDPASWAQNSGSNGAGFTRLEGCPAGGGRDYTQVSGNTPGGGLLGHYPLDGDARDASGHDRHGVIKGATPTTDRFGRAGGAMAFDGKSHIEIPLDINPAAQPQLSFSAWVRADEVNPIRQVMSHDNGGYDRSLGIDHRGGGTGWSSFTGSGEVLGRAEVERGRWLFVAGVWDQEAKRSLLYVDGRVFEKSGECGAGWDKVSLGRNPSYGEHFVGAMDDVRFHGAALTKDDLDRLRAGQGEGGAPMPGGRDYTSTTPFNRPAAPASLPANEVDTLKKEADQLLQDLKGLFKW